MEAILGILNFDFLLGQLHMLQNSLVILDNFSDS
jgi:hypothetical protein